jgi:RHS repeat-associated protein
VAIEVRKETYVPLYDLQGNITCLLDHQRRKIVESYRYSSFGEEVIINERGRVVSDSAVGNPWRYCGKRVDKEVGLVCFGQRYYDSEIGRWISPDPAGNIDGPNLYTFARNNPMTYVDYFGLASEMNENQSKEFSGYFYGEYEPHCHCEAHRDCKRGGDIGVIVGSGGASFSGAGHRVVDFILNNPRFHGTLQALGGLAEASFGGGMTLATYGAAAPFGWPVMAHGLDQFITGISTAFTGRPRDTLTSHLLQKTGMSHQTANFVDSGLSMGGSLGGAYFIQRARVAAIAALSVPESTMVSLEGIHGGKNFKPFTRRYYKENLAELTGISPSGQQVHAHHVFAQQFKEEFLKKGINVHDPKYLTWWEASSHRAAARQYNLDWIEFMTQNPGATEAQVLERGRKMMAQHGIEVNY